MKAERGQSVLWMIPLIVAASLVNVPAQAKYGGGTGTADDPYQIWTPEQMNAIGADPNDWDRHFKVMADIALSAYNGRAGSPAFVPIGTDGRPFTGVFDGAGKVISHLSCASADEYRVGLFGCVGTGGSIRNLGLEDATITPERCMQVGTIAGKNLGSITNCYATGWVAGDDPVGGLVGWNRGTITHCFSTATVWGYSSDVGGLVGWNEGAILDCHATGDTSGDFWVGGLAGRNDGGITVNSYATGEVSASEGFVGGLVGSNYGTIGSCYSTGDVRGAIYPAGGLAGQNVGGTVVSCYSTGRVSGSSSVGGLLGLVAYSRAVVADCYSTGAVAGSGHVGGLIGVNEGGAPITASFWNTETSGQSMSAGGSGKATEELQNIRTYLAANWDFAFADEQPGDTWVMPHEAAFPVLWWQLPQSELPPLPAFSGGSGTSEDPYIISTPAELNSIGHSPRLVSKNFRLATDIDMAQESSSIIGDPTRPFTGRFDGNGRSISNLSLKGDDMARVGLFGYVADPGRIENLTIRNINVNAPTAYFVGALVGWHGGVITNCRANATISGYSAYVGGLVGVNRGTISNSCSAGSATGRLVGGLTASSAEASITNCYSTCSVSGDRFVGGLVALLGQGAVTNCYSSGRVVGTDGLVGGLIGATFRGIIQASFWDFESSTQTTSAGGAGKTTAEMQTAKTFLDAGWDFVGETANGKEDIWWIDEGKDYPRLSWEAAAEPNSPAGGGNP